VDQLVHPQDAATKTLGNGGNQMTITLTREEADGYYCVVCGRFLLEENGVIVHDDVPHPIDMDFGDEEKPQ
jgi:hypothetical protein